MRIEFRRTRPIVYVILAIYGWFLTREYPDNVLQEFIKIHPIVFSSSFFIFLIAAYVFQLREALEVKDGQLFIDLKKVKSKIHISSISAIHHSFDRLSITTNDAEVSINIGQFSHKKVKKLLEYKEIANLTIHRDSQGRATEAHM